MSSCDIQTQNIVDGVLNQHQDTIAQIDDLINQIPCDIPQHGGGISMTNAKYVQLISLVTAILVAVNAVMEVKKIQSGQCDISNMIMNALTKSQYCTTQANALNSAITTAVAEVTTAAGVGFTTYFLAEDEEKKKEESTGGRKAKKSRKARKSKKARKAKKSKKAKKVKKTRKARKVRKAKKSRKA